MYLLSWLKQNHRARDLLQLGSPVSVHTQIWDLVEGRGCPQCRRSPPQRQGSPTLPQSHSSVVQALQGTSESSVAKIPLT